jgi:hypothetical protein
MNKRHIQVALRLPLELHRTLRELAAENHRSLHGEVLHRLTESLKAEKRAKPRLN